MNPYATGDDTVTEVYEQLNESLFPQFVLKNVDPNPLMLNLLSHHANHKCEQLQVIVKEKNETAEMLGREPIVPRIDNKTDCAECHMKKTGGPPDTFNTSNAEYTSGSRAGSHKNWCPHTCIRKFCGRRHGA